jgi:hypothetical protein
MPCLDAHVNKAVHNIETMAFLATKPGRKDWIATTAFYAGLHIVDAVLYHENEALQKHGRSHATREEIVKGSNRLSKLWVCYRSLLNESIVARYLQFEGTPAEQHIDFDRYMPDAKFIPFLREKLGGLIQTAVQFLPNDKKARLQQTFDSQLKDYLKLT